MGKIEGPCNWRWRKWTKCANNRARQLLRNYHDQPHDIRGFEWFLFSERARGDHFLTLDTFNGIVNSAVCFPQDLRRFAIATVDGRVTIHTRDSANPPRVLDAGRRSPKIISRMHQLACSPDGSVLATVGAEGIELWNTADWRRIHVLDSSFLPARTEIFTFST